MTLICFLAGAWIGATVATIMLAVLFAHADDRRGGDDE